MTDTVHAYIVSVVATFRDYEQQHMAKDPPATEKADRNRALAEQGEALLMAIDHPREYRHPRHAWCQPADRPERAFMLIFDDLDMRKMVWTSEGSEALAWAAWDQYAHAWNCTLFAALPQVERPSTAQNLEDVIADALQDSLDVDWTCRTGAKAVVAALAAHRAPAEPEDETGDLLAGVGPS